MDSFQLELETDPQEGILRLRLKDQHGVQLGHNLVRLREHPPGLWEGVFDTRQYVRRCQGAIFEESTGPATSEFLLARLGIFLAKGVLGDGVMGQLTQGANRRTLLVRLPATKTKEGKDDWLAVAVARIPWEIARPRLEHAPLMDRNLLVRGLPAELAAAPPPVTQLEEGKALRVLFVFAEAPGSRPLAMRLEREGLKDMFYKKVLPGRRVEFDVLCHGVTESRLREQIRKARGYHILHWSGHGWYNLLEVRGKDGGKDYLTGGDVVKMFQKAGGFVPQLVFLSACLSGALVEAKNWDELQAAAQGRDGTTPREPAPQVDDIVRQPTGYTSTALDLLRAGVPQVIAMRYEVGDTYARELAKLFYQRLLGDREVDQAESALSLARTQLLSSKDEHARHYDAVDHATPLILGHAGQSIDVPDGPSEQLDRRLPQPRPLLRGDSRELGGSRELDPPSNFVGRSAELTLLADAWLPRKDEDDSQPVRRPAVALAQGMGGLGKTALAAEIIHLWHQEFDWVFAFQAKPLAISLENFLQQVHSRLIEINTTYRKRIEKQPFAAVHLPAGGHLSPEQRQQRMRENFVEAICHARILFVFDNFEKNLESQQSQGGCRCADPEWDRLLGYLAERLPEGSSRLLITCRHALAALSDGKVVWVRLGPLPLADATIFIQGDETLSRLVHDDWPLVRRLITVSRGHPLILTRLAALANKPAVLAEALDKLEAEGFRSLPDVFTCNLSPQQKDQERSYLEDVTTHSVDLLIQRCSPAARRLLWMVTLANEPVMEELLDCVWAGRSAEDEQVRRARAFYQRLPAGKREELLAQVPPEIRDQVKEALERPNESAAQAQPIAPLLEELCAAGLLSKTQVGQLKIYAFHELVRERAASWMAGHAAEFDGRTAEQVWETYGEWYAVQFHRLLVSGEAGSRDAAVEAGRRALVYIVRAGKYERLAAFASGLVNSTDDPVVLACVIVELKELPDELPPGELRCSVRTYVADALNRSDRPDESLALYQEALDEAEGLGNWAMLAWITQNWAIALRTIGRFQEAKAKFLDSAAAEQRAKSPRVRTVLSELSAWQIDVILGNAKEALPKIEARLNQLRTWWQRSAAGEYVADAPDLEELGNAVLVALSFTWEANLALKRWQSCLDLLDEIEEIKTRRGAGLSELAATRFNKYGPLLRLGRRGEARSLLEECREVFRQGGDTPREAMALSALADYWDDIGDVEQAIALERQALLLRNTLANPTNRAISHNNLAHYLARLGRWAEASQHHLASIGYRLSIHHEQHLLTSLHNFAAFITIAARTGQTYELPRLAELLTLPEFEPLKVFLEQHGVSISELQETIDELDQQVRRKLAGNEGQEDSGRQASGG